MNDWIVPDWPAPKVVRAVSTTRMGGFSSSPYESLNLGDHVGDEPARVRRNRKYLMQRLGLVSEPQWLQQVHGCEVVVCGQTGPAPQADAITATAPGEVCAVLTADCLPCFCVIVQVNRLRRFMPVGVVSRLVLSSLRSPVSVDLLTESWHGLVPRSVTRPSRWAAKSETLLCVPTRGTDRPFPRAGTIAGWRIFTSLRETD